MRKKNFHSHLAKMLGTYITETRVEMGLLQSEFAKRLKVSAQFLGRIERGEVMIPQPALIQAIHLLDLDENKLNKIYRLAGELQVSELFAVRPKAKRYASR